MPTPTTRFLIQMWTHQTRWFMLASIVMLALLTLVYFDQRPLLIPLPSISVLKPERPSSIGSVMLLQVAPPETPAATRSPIGAWLDWAHQSLGPMHLWRFNQPLPTHPSPAVLVLPTSEHALHENQRAELLRYVQAGGILLIDPVTPDLVSLAGWRETRSAPVLDAISSQDPIIQLTPSVPEEALALLARLPRPPTLLQAVPSDATEVLWRSAQGPLLTRHALGQGHVYATTFPLGRWLHQLQQGVPDPDGVLRNRWPALQSLPLETNDLVLHEQLLTAEWPVADLLEDALWVLLNQHQPLASLWLYPNAAPGAFLMTHDEESQGDKAVWMAEHDVRMGCPTTEFVVPSPAMQTHGPPTYKRLDVEIGLHAVLPSAEGSLYPGSNFGFEGRLKLYGFWKFHPIMRLLSPAEQSDALQTIFPAHPRATSSRTHFLAWPTEHSTYFQRLIAAGIQIDSSYGPDLKNRGFLFGTARPFQPLAPNGLPYGIYELPFISAEDLGGADAAFMERMLKQSQQQTHQALSMLFHPNAFKWHPSLTNYDTWKGLCTQAQRYAHVPMTMSGLSQFWRQRAQSHIQQQLRGRHLSLKVSIVGDGQSIVLPARWQGQQLELPRSVPSSSRLVRLGQPFIQIPLSAGRHELMFTYR